MAAKYWKESKHQFCQAGKNLAKDLRAIPAFAWTLIILHAFEGFIGYTVDLNMMTFFHQKFSMNIQTSGELFGLQGIIVLLLGIPGGIMLDKLGVRFCTALGFFSAIISRLILAFSNDQTTSVMTILFGVSIGGGLIALGLHIGLSRMKKGGPCVLAFTFLYVSNNFGDAVASWMNPLMIDFGGFNQFQFMFICTALVAFVGAAIVLIFLQEPPPEDADEEEEVDDSSYWSIFNRRDFWRAFVAALVFLGVCTMFKHLSSIVPIYMQNLYGPAVNFGLAVGTNPSLIIWLAPVVAVMTRNVVNRKLLLFTGSLISALSPIPMLVSRPADSVLPVYEFNILFTLGEAIYSPELSRLFVSIPPPGKKGIYSILITFPRVFGTFFSGVEAGYLLNTFCPDPVTVNYDYWGTYSCANLWLVVMAVALITPITFPFVGDFILTDAPTKQRKPNDSDIELDVISVNDTSITNHPLII